MFCTVLEQTTNREKGDALGVCSRLALAPTGEA